LLIDELRVERVDAKELYELRRRILRKNDPAVRVDDSRDDSESSRHFGGFLGSQLVVCASFFPSSAPVNAELETYQLRYMATDFAAQGKGYGAVVLEHASEALRLLGAEQLWANARNSALGFYLATGWIVVEGSEHLSPETNLPHTVIYKSLSVNSPLI
jgi:GNAT superfamily N-acetyltransferase